MRAYRAERAFDGERVLPGGALVLVDGGGILGVEAADAAVPDGCPVTDLPGATLLPGLVDAHVHLCGDASMRALDRLPELGDDELDAVVDASLARHLAAGVTAVRDLGDARWAVVDRHRGPGAGPTVVAAGPPITSPGGHCAVMGGEAAGTAALRRAVGERVERGADVVKIMTSGGLMTPGTDILGCQYPLDEVRAVVEEAHRAALPVTAHAHSLAAVELCVAAGVDGIEHCSCMGATGAHTPARLAADIARAGIDVCPTLGRPPGMMPPPRIQAVMDRIGLTDEGRREQVRGLIEAGVSVVAGTDAGINPAKPPGLLAECVVELVAAGMPSVQALTAATSGAARACGLAARTGRLLAGHDADLLAVDGDPLAAPSSLRAVRLVVSRGREFVPGTAARSGA